MSVQTKPTTCPSEIVLRRCWLEEPADAAVRKHAAELALPGFPRVERRRDLTQDRLAVVGVDALFPSGLEGRFGGETGQVGDAFAEVETATLEVGPKDTHRDHARERREFQGFWHVLRPAVKIGGADPNPRRCWAAERGVYHARTHGSDDLVRTNTTIRHSSLRLQLLSGGPPIARGRGARDRGGMPGRQRSPAAPTGTAPTDVAAQFEQMWTTFDRNYSYFDYKRIDWNALKAEFAPRVAGLTQNEFVLLMQNMLGRLHDQHVVLTSGNTTLRTYTPDYFVNWDNSVWQQYLARGSAQVRNGAVSAVFDGVPYIAIQSWNPTRVSVSDLDAFLDAFRDRPALILDVRMNPGGNDQPAFDFAGRFTTSTTTSGFVQFRNGPGHSDFTPRQARTFSPRGSFQFTRPVLLLIGRFCASSNEASSPRCSSCRT